MAADPPGRVRGYQALRGARALRELARHGPMPLGSAVWAGAGRLRLAGIIHVAGIDLLWRASHRSIRASVSNALPIIDSGSGGYRVDEAIILETLGSMDADLAVILVRH